MKTLLDYIPNLFKSASNITVESVSNRINRLSGISNSASGFWNTVSIAKTVCAQRDSADIAMTILTNASNMEDVTFEGVIHQEGEDLVEHYHVCYNNDLPTDEPTLMMQQACETIASYVTDDFQVIGTFQGKPIYAINLNRRANSNPQSSEYVPYLNEIHFFLGDPVQIYPYSETKQKCFLILEQSAWEGFIYNQIFTHSISDDDPWTFKVPYIQDDGTVVDYGTMTLDTLLNSITNDYISNECLSNIIARAQSDGVITREQIESIIDQYSKTSITATLRSMIAGSGRLDSLSVITLVGTLYKNQGASYDDQSNDKHFDVYDSPEYITSIVQLVCQIVSFAIIAIISIVFKAIGIIVSMIITVMMAISTLIAQNVTHTEAKIEEATLTPVVNNPLLTFQLTKTQMEIFFRNYGLNADINELDRVLMEEGCALATPYFEGASPYYYWILPRDWTDNDSKYTVQVLISVANCNMHNSYNIMAPTAIELPDPVEAAGVYYGSFNITKYPITTAEFNQEIANSYFHGYADTRYDYIKMEDASIRRCVSVNVCKALNDLFTMDATRIEHRWTSSAGYGLGLDIVDVMDDNDSVTAQSCTLKNLLKLIAENRRLHVYDFTDAEACYFIAQVWPFNIMVSQDAEITDNWDGLTKLFETCSAIGQDYVTIILSRNNMYDKAKFVDDTISSGFPISKPAVTWPKVSKGALLRAIIISAAVAGAIAGIAVTTKIAMKRIAFNRLSSRQDAFDTAKEEYSDMRKNPNAYTDAEKLTIKNNYRKANTRLTRAWSLADKLGLSMFNGFSTGSSSNAYGNGSSSPLTNFTSTIFNNQQANEADSDDIFDMSDDIRTVAHMIGY